MTEPPREPGARGATADVARARLARGLGERLRALPLAIEAARCRIGTAAVPSYPGGHRPTAEVVLAGAGCAGRGEHVAWTEADHRELAALVEAWAPRGRSTVGEFSPGLAARVRAPYARAALEAAALDLALRQALTTPFALAGAEPRPVRYVVSFAQVADPVAVARAEIGARPTLELKVDADSAWSDATWAALAALDRVAVVDFKRSGRTADHERAHAALPLAWIEDPLPDPTAPWSASLLARLALDAPVTDAAAIDAAAPPPAAVNVKPARMGGVLAAIDAVRACAERGIACYFGGMFEVGVGRRQLLDLAALLTPDGPNDIAPIARAGAPAARPPRLLAPRRAVGFGGVLEEEPDGSL